MKKFWKFFTAAVLITISLTAYAAYTCGIDGYAMYWTGQTTVDSASGKLLYQQKCINGHISWTTSAS